MARKIKELLALEELRDALRMTQQELAQTLQVDQHRTDINVSTLRRCIAAMGGQLEIRAVFPQGTVRITQFEQLAANE
jgi:hypothetical protein